MPRRSGDDAAGQDATGYYRPQPHGDGTTDFAATLARTRAQHAIVDTAIGLIMQTEDMAYDAAFGRLVRACPGRLLPAVATDVITAGRLLD